MERVCFIRPKGEPGPILIVAGPSPAQLLSVAQFGSPKLLSLMGAVDASYYPEEWWHETLAPWRLHGAWYDPKAQVLCRVEDALTGRLEAPVTPEALDPTEDPLDPLTDATEPPERVPPHVQAQVAAESAEERARARWAWPIVDPYPPVHSTPTPISEVPSLIRRLASQAA